MGGLEGWMWLSLFKLSTYEVHLEGKVLDQILNIICHNCIGVCEQAFTSSSKISDFRCRAFVMITTSSTVAKWVTHSSRNTEGMVANPGTGRYSGSDDHLKWQSSVIRCYLQWHVKEPQGH